MTYHIKPTSNPQYDSSLKSTLHRLCVDVDSCLSAFREFGKFATARGGRKVRSLLPAQSREVDEHREFYERLHTSGEGPKGSRGDGVQSPAHFSSKRRRRQRRPAALLDGHGNLLLDLDLRAPTLTVGGADSAVVIELGSVIVKNKRVAGIAASASPPSGLMSPPPGGLFSPSLSVGSDADAASGGGGQGYGAKGVAER